MNVRAATQADIAGIVALNQRCYPGLGAVWTPAQVASQLKLFPEGQLVIPGDDGRILASASTLIVSLGRDPYRDHTWAGITDGGMFFNHDPYGDTLYGADVAVDPDHRRQGLARALYAARRELAAKHNLKRIVLGGRLHDYHQHPDLSVEEYARRVEAVELVDPVLSFQLAEGFALEKVLPNYLEDAQSRNYGTFLEWHNPRYDPTPRKQQTIRVSCVQYRMRKLQDFAGFARQVEYFVDVASGYDADIAVFPELLTAQLMSYIDTKTPLEAIRVLTELTGELDALFVKLAADYQLMILGGSHPIRKADDRIENVASLYLPDGTIHRQPKLHITPNEAASWGIEGGSSLQVFDTPKGKVGILICYDIEFPEAARYLADQGAQVILVPFCTDDRQGYLRVRYCAQARAIENQIYVALAGTVGNLPDTDNLDIQYAQSAVLSPSDFVFARDGILVEASVNTETVITTDLDFEALDEAINSGTVRPRYDRRPDLFEFKAKLGDA